MIGYDGEGTHGARCVWQEEKIGAAEAVRALSRSATKDKDMSSPNAEWDYTAQPSHSCYGLLVLVP